MDNILTIIDDYKHVIGWKKFAREIGFQVIMKAKWKRRLSDAIVDNSKDLSADETTEN